MQLFYTSTDGGRDGRASYFYKVEAEAKNRVTEQNAKAEAMGLTARYELAVCDDSELDQEQRDKQIR